MKAIISLVITIFLVSFTTVSQQQAPVLIFEEEVESHNVKVTCDGEFLFTANGGDDQGVIKKYTMEGDFVKGYDIPLDMRSIMYNKKDKSLWINCADLNVYRIKDLESGTYELVFEQLQEDKNASFGMDPKGKHLYYFLDNVLQVFEIKSGEAVNTYGGIKCGKSYSTGRSAIAVDESHFYTWDSNRKQVYKYDKKNAKLIQTYELEQGTFGFSLSYANGMIFVAEDGDDGIGFWYGYKFN